MSGSFSRFERVSLRVKVRNIYAGSLSMGGAQAGGDHSGSASRGRGRSEERHCRAARVIGRPNYFARIAWFFAPAAVNREKTRVFVPSMTRTDSIGRSIPFDIRTSIPSFSINFAWLSFLLFSRSSSTHETLTRYLSSELIDTSVAAGQLISLEYHRRRRRGDNVDVYFLSAIRPYSLYPFLSGQTFKGFRSSLESVRATRARTLLLKRYVNACCLLSSECNIYLFVCCLQPVHSVVYNDWCDRKNDQRESRESRTRPKVLEKEKKLILSHYEFTSVMSLLYVLRYTIMLPAASWVKFLPEKGTVYNRERRNPKTKLH